MFPHACAVPITRNEIKSSKSTVYLIDDHPVIIQGISMLINAEPDLAVAGVSASWAVALKEIAQLKPNVVVMDIALAATNGIEVLKNLRVHFPDQKVLMLSMHDENLYATRSMKAGARGYLMKESASEEVVVAIRQNIRFLNDVAAFQKTQFSSPAVKLLSEAIASGQTPPATDPPLNELEQSGKALFARHCATCHGGPTQTVPLATLPPGIRDIRISKPVPPFAADLPFAPSPLQPRNWVFRVGGTLTVRPSTDPGQALLTGSIAQLTFSMSLRFTGFRKLLPTSMTTAPQRSNRSCATTNSSSLPSAALLLYPQPCCWTRRSRHCWLT